MTRRELLAMVCTLSLCPFESTLPLQLLDQQLQLDFVSLRLEQLLLYFLDFLVRGLQLQKTRVLRLLLLECLYQFLVVPQCQFCLVK